jgi:LytS/YehU family sensor histidine kinase
VSAPTLALPSNERRPTSDARADVAPDVARPAPGRALRWAAWDVAVWTVVALLFAGQGAARLQQQLAEAQLHALGAQLHPHFLFNTLHVISALVRHEPKRAEELIARLSELLREMLESSDRVEIPLSEELAFLEKYVDIQEARFGPRLVVTCDVQPAEALDVPVPRLVLQPLVENAIRHGTARRAGVGTVDVRAECFNGRLTMVVRDDGAGVPPGGPTREGVGLSSTRARLQQLYGDAASLTIEPAPAGGTVCTVRMPCRPPAAPVAPARRGA